MTRDDDRSRDVTPALTDEALDAALSELLDGELDAATADALRGRLAREPALAARFERLGEADGRLRLLASELPTAERLAELRAGVQARIDADTGADSRDHRASDVTPATHAAPRRRPGRWLAPAAAALAAGIALYLLTGRVPDEAPRDATPIARSASPPADEHEPPRPGALARIEEPVERAPASARPDARTSLAVADPGTVDAPLTPNPLGDVVGSDDALLASASEVELAVALEYDVLTDLDVIENLELLELLAMLDTPEPM